jgi:hypothetical protein
MATESPLKGEISRLAFFISIPHLIASPVSVGISHLLHEPNSVPYDLMEILDFIVISFPLTLSIAILFVIIERGDFNLGWLLIIVGGAALLSNLLHKAVSSMPSVDVSGSFNEAFDYKANRGSSAVFHFVYRIFGIYWRDFGPVLFIQSCCVGLYAGYKYFRIQEKIKKEKKNQTPVDTSKKVV